MQMLKSSWISSWKCVYSFRLKDQQIADISSKSQLEKETGSKNEVKENSQKFRWKYQEKLKQELQDLKKKLEEANNQAK